MSQPQHTTRSQTVAQLIREAETAWSQQDYAKSIQLIEQVSRKWPSDPSIQLQLARAHGLRYDFVTAERYLEKAVQISPQRAHMLGEAGRICVELEHTDLALRYLERASRSKGVSVGVLIALADIYLRDSRLDEAAHLVARAAQIDRSDPLVLLGQAALRRLNGQDDEAESLLRSLLSNPRATVPVRVQASYDLAGLLDRGGRYDEAMSTLLEAKAIQRTLAAPHAPALQLLQDRAKEMEQTVTAAVLARWRADADKLQPSRRIALLCGHPRAGTTLLEQVLDAHSDIVSAEETKIMHDDAYLPLIRDLPEGTSILQALDAAPPSLLRHARENYFRCTELLIRKSIGGRLLVDKNPALNILIPMVVRVFPEAKFLVALRDPRDVVLSCFLQAMPLTPVSSAYLSLEGTVRQYASAMGFWLEMRPRLGDQWMYVRYEEMVDDLPGVARGTLKFLGVPFEENVLKFYEHARTKRVKSPSYADVVKPVYRSAVGRWLHYEKYLAPYMAGLERFFKEFNYR
jgi:Tfp pilus assembly protein PilF